MMSPFAGEELELWKCVLQGDLILTDPWDRRICAGRLQTRSVYTHRSQEKELYMPDDVKHQISESS